MAIISRLQVDPPREGVRGMSKRHTVYHRIFAAILTIGITALLISTILLVVNSATRTPSSASTATLPKKSHSLDLTTFLASYIQHKGKLTPQILLSLERPYIAFSADSLAPSDDKLTGTLEVIVPPALPPFMKLNGKSVFNCAGPECVPYSQYANDTITAKLLVTRSGANFEQLQTIALKDINSTSQLGVHEFPVTIPLKGYAGWYPQDNYTADVSLAVALPAGMTPNVDTGAYAQVHSFLGGTVANDYAVSVKPSPSSFQQLESNANDTFAISISRDWYNQFFVYTVSLIPALFALLFLHLLFFAGGSHGVGRSFEHFTEALVVSVLSVLPLRVVLVPGDISGLTRVDLTLGVGLVLIVTVAAGKYAQEIWSSQQPPESEDEAEHESRSVFPIHDEDAAGSAPEVVG